LVVAIAVIICGLVYVEVRSRNPEWVAFQEKGIALAVQRLQDELATEKVAEKKAAIQVQIAALKRRTPEVIEISPFGGKLASERCMTCHFGIEDVSASHPNAVFGCVCCHGGNGPDLTVAGAHRGLRGGRNPARLDLASLSCGSVRSELGKCHSEREHPLLNRADNVPKSIMATNAGIIGILRFQWGVEPNSDSAYAVKPVSDGQTRLGEVPAEFSAHGTYRLPDSHFRKFCATCHLWTDKHEDRIGRMAGCPACHAPYAPDGRYKGGDPTINRTEQGHATTHTITNRISDDHCRSCHNRSARIALNYRGEMENEQYGTPFVRGGLNDRTLGDDRFYTQLVPDVHNEKGMACIDCHTGQDTMGDGRIYRFMKDQVEIRCEDCHGGYSEPPRTMKVDKYDALVQTLIRTAGFGKPQEGDTILVTSKGRPLVNIRLTEKGFRLTGKLTGKEHPVSVVTGKMNGHAIKGHERLECDTCHSAWSPQCYGCHQELDFSHQAKDGLSGQTTPGRWAEGRTYFRFERNIYGINSRGRVGILVPGCQVWNSVVGADGKVVSGYDSRVMKLQNGLNSVAVGSTHPHTTRTQVPRCVECHLDPKALGLGEGTLKLDAGSGRITVNALYDSPASGLKIPFALDSVVTPQGEILQGTSHKLARGFNGEELKKIVSIAPCLPCHDRYDDPVWSKPGPYRETPACLKALEKMKGNHDMQ
jgi:hypothetical protein